MKAFGFCERRINQFNITPNPKSPKQDLNVERIRRLPGFAKLSEEEAQQALDSLHTLAVILYELFALRLESQSPSHEQYDAAEEVCQAA